MRIVWPCTVILGFSCALGLAQTTQDLVNDGKNTDNVTTESMGYSRQSYSPLKQIDKSNVKRLVPIWSTSLMNDQGELAAPVVYNGVMYAINGKWTFAIDVETGRQIWRTAVELEPGVTRAPINRGAPAIYNGKLFRVTVDNHLVALDMKTGKEVWNQKFADAKDGYYASSAPIIANGVLISGVSGGESTTRGFLDGWDPDTGKKLWRRHTIPAPGEPGSETWPKNSDAWSQGGGPTWRSGSYDPQLDLVYWGTGNAEPYNPKTREGLDNLYTNSVLAIRPKTGEIACYYQYTPNDVYDVDATDEQILADLRVNGQLRKVMIQTNKNGFLYVLDRTNCKLIAAHPYVKVNWATEIDLKTGRPALTDVYQRFAAGEEVEIWPSRGTNAVPSAFNPSTGLVYANTWNIARIQKIAAPRPVQPGKDSTGVVARIPQAQPGDIPGYFAATADRREEMAGAAHRFSKCGRNARDRRRPGIYGQDDRRIPRARPGHRENAVAVQDRLERQCDRDHLYAQRPPVCDRRIGPRRHSGDALRCARRPIRRFGVDVRVDEGVIPVPLRLL
jgi:alcohol dehydrogenase (cytochrome c)